MVMRKNKLMLFITTAALIVSMMLPSFASAAFNGTYYIRNKVSGYMMTVNGAQTYDGARIVQWYEEHTTNQQWEIRSVGLDQWGRDIYTIKNVNSGKLLDVPGGKDVWGATLIQWGNNGGDNQRWQIWGYNDGNSMSYTIQNYSTTLLADVNGGSRDAGVNIIQWPYNKGDNQKWYIYPR
jgi:hypothetical protein